MSKVIIFGAGASKYAKVPLQTDFIDELVKFLEKDNYFNKYHKEHIEDFKKITKNTNSIDLLFSAIDYLIIEEQKKDNNSGAESLLRKLNSMDNDTKQKIKLKASSIKKNLCTLSSIGIKRFSEDIVINFLRPKTNKGGRISDNRLTMDKCINKKLKLDNDDVVITFNYDMLIDQALWKTKKWNPIDGYCLARSCLEQYRLMGYFQIECQSRISLLKLHGSINWDLGGFGLSDNNLSIKTHSRRHGESYFERIPSSSFNANSSCSAIGMSDNDDVVCEEATLVLFGYLREEKFDSLWKKAKKSIECASELFIIGYSFPDADAETNELIALADKDIPITIINPEACKIKNKLMKLKKFKKIKSIEEKFEDWVHANNS